MGHVPPALAMKTGLERQRRLPKVTEQGLEACPAGHPPREWSRWDGVGAGQQSSAREDRPIDEDTRAGDRTLPSQSPAGPPQDAWARRMPGLGLAVAQEAIAHQEPGSLIPRWTQAQGQKELTQVTQRLPRSHPFFLRRAGDPAERWLGSGIPWGRGAAGV